MQTSNSIVGFIERNGHGLLRYYDAITSGYRQYFIKYSAGWINLIRPNVISYLDSLRESWNSMPQ
jgi:hypothetical protein